MHPAKLCRMKKQWKKFFNSIIKENEMSNYMLYQDEDILGPYSTRSPALRGHWIVRYGVHYKITEITHRPQGRIIADLVKDKPSFIAHPGGNGLEIVEVIPKPTVVVNTGDLMVNARGEVSEVIAVVHDSSKMPIVYVKRAE